MALIATIVIVLALAGALASWIYGARCYLRAAQAQPDRSATADALSAVVWPFTRGRLSGIADGAAAMFNKALVAFFTCLMIAVTATSLATNLSRLSR